LRISIVTPSYNQAEFIERTIRSVLGQRGDFELEYLVVDGGSTDGTLDILRRYSNASREPARGFRYISEKDNGPTEAIAKGFRAARGEVVAWLNSDDLYCEGALQRVERAFQAAPGARWLCGRCRIVDAADRERRKWITAYKNAWLRRYSLRKLLILNFISQPAVFLRRSLIEELGLPDDGCKAAFDYAYWLRIARQYPPLILEDYLACFRVHPASIGGSDPVRQFREERDMAARYNPGFAFVGPLHTLNYWAIVAAYKLLRWSGR
jgi:glycosyltransferase involved in cell wall biosynthesis